MSHIHSIPKDQNLRTRRDDTTISRSSTSSVAHFLRSFYHVHKSSSISAQRFSLQNNILDLDRDDNLVFEGIRTNSKLRLVLSKGIMEDSTISFSSSTDRERPFRPRAPSCSFLSPSSRTCVSTGRTCRRLIYAADVDPCSRASRTLRLRRGTVGLVVTSIIISCTNCMYFEGG